MRKRHSGHREQFGYALEGLAQMISRITTLVDETVPALQAALREAGAP